MPSLLPVPIRVLVKGASNVGWVSWMGGPRSDFIFPRAMEAQLLAHGRPCEVHTYTAPGEPVNRILQTWQREVLGFSPDVIVLSYGYLETIHLFLPRWLERHVHSLKARPRTVPGMYRKWLLHPAWRRLALLQARLDTIVNPTLRKRRPRRVAADLERYITHVQKVGSPMVILFELLPVSGQYRSWFPGMNQRVEVMNEELRALVTRLDLPHVRQLRVSELVEMEYGGDLERATPDGFHYSPRLHQLIGNKLAEIIEEWAETQPHLATAEIGARTIDPSEPMRGADRRQLRTSGQHSESQR